ncbi:hypothetical protein IGW_05042 [Bacillus cereus ISP3191]|uniref:phBC6A51 family helix-turn-helix protein n=1 Tax=Bacillus cereus TaxID=1396 RepID=UPI0002796518|nr:phBC6A51 family helix-turn-helix protein [Bacillus cereus]EJQ88363.1 hypothetical protein IGW_05042 [Bacillus cereus ISP3191]MDR4323133.1 hypothetical protein [Bacillus paranthracis]TNP03811.1 hypothetical protein FHY65_16095 [Bacillus cereus]
MKQRKLTPPQLEVLTQIFERQRAGETLTAIAKDMKLDRRTIYNWRQRPEWVEMEKELRRRLINDAYESVMETLVKNAVSGKSPKWTELYLKSTGRLKDVAEIQTKQAITIKEEGFTDDMIAELDRILSEHVN